VLRRHSEAASDEATARANDFARLLSTYDRSAFDTHEHGPAVEPSTTTDPHRKPPDPKLAELLREGALLRYRAWLVERDGKALLPASDGPRRVVHIDDDRLQVLVRELDGWSRRLQPSIDHAMSAGDLGLLRDVNASSSAATRSGAELRELARRLVQESPALVPQAPAAAPVAVASPVVPSKTGAIAAVVALLLGAAVVNGWLWTSSQPDGPETAPIAGIARLERNGGVGMAHAVAGAAEPSDAALLEFARSRGLERLTLVDATGKVVAVVDVAAGNVGRVRTEPAPAPPPPEPAVEVPPELPLVVPDPPPNVDQKTKTPARRAPPPAPVTNPPTTLDPAPSTPANGTTRPPPAAAPTTP